MANLQEPRPDVSRPVNRVVSLRDVAKEAKVSAATVSMVLNGNPRISRATATRIQRLVERMGYQPNRLAQSLSSKHTHVIAVMLPALRHAFADAYFGEIISGICDKAGKMGYKVMLEQAKPEFVKDKQHVRLYERRFVDGVLCLGTNDRHRWLGDFAAAGCPAMLVDNAVDEFKVDSVVCDYASGAEQVMNYLIQLGHRRIGLITAGQDIKMARRVRKAYETQLHNLGVDCNDTCIVDGKFTEEGGAAAASKLLDAHPDMTAIFAGNDKMAIGAMHEAVRRGLRVPADLSVVGFDDLRHAAFINPTLTTIHLPLYEVGSSAMERLVERIHGRPEPVKEVLPTHLIVRQSTAMAKTTTAAPGQN
ncbi:MAG: LacI family transcriptional regulator [Phycisphaerales bacterium]|nr:LacI family transcriptional regulator [Phycisphaerales bacterium]